MFFKAHSIHHAPVRRQKPGLVAGINALLLHRFFIQIGIGLFGLFAPIYIYEICGRRLWAPLLMSVAFYLCNLFFQPIAAVWVTRLGMKRSLMIGSVLIALYHLLLSFRDELPLLPLLGVSVLVASCYHVFYWLPYHVELVELSPTKKRGRILGYFAALGSLVGIFAPLIGGFSIAQFGYRGLILASFFFLLSSVPLLIPLKTVKERYVFGYIETFRVLFAKKNRLMFYVYMIEGAESIVGSLFWPLFLFSFFKGQYVAIGINAAVVVAVGCLLEIAMGFLVEKKDSKPLLHVGVGLSALGWILKALVTTIAQVAFASIFHAFALILERIPFQTLMYARAADAGHYIDEYTVLREMSLCIGRIGMLLFCLACFPLVGFSGVFFFAAIATLGFNLITRLHRRAPQLSV